MDLLAKLWGLCRLVVRDVVGLKHVGFQLNNNNKKHKHSDLLAKWWGLGSANVHDVVGLKRVGLTPC